MTEPERIKMLLDFYHGLVSMCKSGQWHIAVPKARNLQDALVILADVFADELTEGR